MPAVVPTLMAGQPHSTEAGSVEMELTNRASHNHPLFREDNEAVYHLVGKTVELQQQQFI
jgi:hypothetical protein